MAYLTQMELQGMGFRKLGHNVKISTKASIYNPELIEIGDETRIDDFCLISGRVVLGKFNYIGPYSLLAGGQIGIEAGDFVGMSYGVYVFSQSDDYTGAAMTNPTIPMKFKLETREKVILGKHAALGAGSMVLPGVQMAEGCSLGAKTLLLESTSPWGIYVGNPAHRIHDRKKDILALEKQFLLELAKSFKQAG